MTDATGVESRASERGDDRKETVVAVGKESVGKSELVGSLTGDAPTTGNFRGTTVETERYETEGYVFVDTPGIMLGADTETTRTAIRAVEDTDTVLLVVRATNLDEDVDDLLPLVQGTVGAVVVTFWDKVENQSAAKTTLADLESKLGVPVVPVDARSLSRPIPDGGHGDSHGGDYGRILRAIESGGQFPGTTDRSTGIHLEPPETVLERPLLGPIIGLCLLVLPTALAVQFANAVAGKLSPSVTAALRPLVESANELPGPLAAVLGGDYGLLSMGPFLFVWAGPTILVFATVLAVYKQSGLVTRITASLHPWLRRVGLTGRDLVRVVMGFGCNVPAVTSTRGCSDCTRKTTVSAIGFGSACSYQFPATLAVFAAVDLPWLALPYLLVLAVTTLVYARLIAPERARTASLEVERAFLQWPSLRSVRRETWSVIRSFFGKALPVFVVICVVAALFDYVGGIALLGGLLGPAMAAFNLPAETALAVVLASVRKDGLLLLKSDATSATLAAMTPVQVLTGVYLAGVLLPCLVTVFTIATELSPRFAATVMVRQAGAAIGFSLLLAWGGALLI